MEPENDQFWTTKHLPSSQFFANNFQLTKKNGFHCEALSCAQKIICKMFFAVQIFPGLFFFSEKTSGKLWNSPAVVVLWSYRTAASTTYVSVDGVGWVDGEKLCATSSMTCSHKPHPWDDGAIYLHENHKISTIHVVGKYKIVPWMVWGKITSIFFDHLKVTFLQGRNKKKVTTDDSSWPRSDWLMVPKKQGSPTINRKSSAIGSMYGIFANMFHKN